MEAIDVAGMDQVNDNSPRAYIVIEERKVTVLVVTEEAVTDLKADAFSHRRWLTGIQVPLNREELVGCPRLIDVAADCQRRPKRIWELAQ